MDTKQKIEQLSNERMNVEIERKQTYVGNSIPSLLGSPDDLIIPSTPQVFSTSFFPREFRKEKLVYIGRHGPHGNPFAIGIHGDRDEVIAKYEAHTMLKLRIDASFRAFFVESLKDSNLLCHCKPKACHGDVILKLLQLIALGDPRVAPVPSRCKKPFFTEMERTVPR